MRDLIDLRKFAEVCNGRELALCTLVGKQHFGYRAIGAKKIIERGQGSCGLLSGGCLEGEINQTARDNWDKMPFIKSFSTMAEADRFMGYQTGCPGVIDVLFEPIHPETDIDLYLPFGNDAKASAVAVILNDPYSTRRAFVNNPKPEKNIFIDPWHYPINLFLIGCGPDAPAFAELAEPMGWTMRFIDYRGGFDLPEKYKPNKVETIPLTDIARIIPEGERNAVVLMTHNYEADLTILSQLVDKKIGYLGCLGPKTRYDQLKVDLLKIHHLPVDPNWEKIVHAPAGLFTSGRAPEEIALSIIAQIQSLLRLYDRKQA